MLHETSPTYPPLNTLKPVADEVWIVDGPMIRFGIPGFKMPFPTRATIIRLAGKDLFVHSPTPSGSVRPAVPLCHIRGVEFTFDPITCRWSQRQEFWTCAFSLRGQPAPSGANWFQH